MIQEAQDKIQYRRSFCENFDEFSEVAQQWSLDFKQLDSGNFNAGFSLINVGPFLLSSFQVNRQIEQKCLSPLGYRNFGILANPDQSFYWRGQTINGNNIVKVPRSREVEAMCFPGFEFYTISIDENWLENYIASECISKLDILDTGSEVLNLNEKSISRIRNLLHQIFIEYKQQALLLQNTNLPNVIVNKLSSVFLGIELNPNSLTKLPTKRIRDIALQRALDCIHNDCIDWPSITKLSEISGASQRTLEYAFKEKYGFGPKEYLVKHHLNNVYKIIKKSDPSAVKIKDIAHDFGFWHMGQFGVAYRKLFGEVPSVTLAR